MSRSSLLQKARGSALLTGEALGPRRERSLPSSGASGSGPPRHAGGKAKGPMKALTDGQLKRLIGYASTACRLPEAALLKIGLAYTAGMRASEIAKISWRDVTDAEGNVADVVRIPAHVAKLGRPREVPMDGFLRDCLIAYRRRFPDLDNLATAYSDGRPQSPSAVKAWFWCLYHRLGFEDCASHSGRKTFITNLAKAASQAGMTLRDVQELAGHARLETTQRYIALSPNHTKLIMAASPSRLFESAAGGER